MDAEQATAPDIRDSEPSWRARPLLLAGLGLATGLIVHLILGEDFDGISAVRAATLMGVMMGAALIGFTLERRMWWASVAFSLAVALVGALVVWWNGTPDGWSAGEGWRMVSLFLAVAIAAPLFQAARDEGARRFPYAAVHDHAWTNVVLWCACWVFVAIVWLMLWLLATLFGLIKIDLLRELLEKDWFARGLLGLAFGAGLGLLREHDGVVRLLQRVVAMVLSVLAPVLAVGLVVFVLALPFTGLQALWDATSQTTPILLCCAVGALILTNAVIGNAPEHERRFPLLRFGAMALAAVILPLAILAAVATGLRIDQYGYTPERLWGVVFVALACLYGAAYLAALCLGRLGWAARVRPFNLALAFITCGMAVVLATPLISFNAISTRDQLARLESGKLTPEKFDWRALAFDFGEPGRAALKRLQSSANATIRTRANEVAKAERRWNVEDTSKHAENRAEVAANTRVLPQGQALPEGLRDVLARSYTCTDDRKCSVLMASATEALIFHDHCFAAPKPRPTQSPTSTRIPVPPAPGSYGCPGGDRYVLNGAWEEVRTGREMTAEERQRLPGAFAAGAVEIRTVSRRQAFVGGVPVGQAFE